MKGATALRGGGLHGSTLCTLGEAADVVHGRRLAGSPSLGLKGVAADTRAVRPGDLFCALRGERVDAHSLLQRAFAAGASAALVDRPAGDGWRLADVPAGAGVIAVSTVVGALGRLARWHLDRLSPAPCVVGVTGSVGKTGTRALIAAALGGGGSPVLAAERSFNTEVTLPLICLRAEPGHRFIVLELAMRGPGQIGYLAGVCRPTVGVVTVIGESHMELLGSVEAIMAAKGELVRALPGDGWAVLNADDPRQTTLAAWSPAPVRWYGMHGPADVRAIDLAPLDGGVGWRFTARFREGGRAVAVRLPLPGRHQVGNALAALACAEVLGVDLEAAAGALGTVTPTDGRLMLLAAGELRILDDAYNSAPQSASAALAALADLAPPGRRAAVLGDMLELGPAAIRGHEVVGRAAAAAGVSWLLTVGPLARGIAASARGAGLPAGRVREAADREAALAVLPALLESSSPGTTVLIKGSRSVGLEEIVRAAVAWGRRA